MKPRRSTQAGSASSTESRLAPSRKAAPGAHVRTIGAGEPEEEGPTARAADVERGWVEGIREGDEEAFEALFHRYYAELCSFAAGFVGSFDQAREVVQDVLLKIWERRDRWRVRTTLQAYLYQAVRNQALNHVRQEKRRRAVVLDLDLPVFATQHTPEDAVSVREVLQKVQAAIDRLPERQCTAFTLHRRHGLTYDEIAEVMDISPRTVEVHISKALHALRKAIGQ